MSHIYLLPEQYWRLAPYYTCKFVNGKNIFLLSLEEIEQFYFQIKYSMPDKLKSNYPIIASRERVEDKFQDRRVWRHSVNHNHRTSINIVEKTILVPATKNIRVLEYFQQRLAKGTYHE